MAPSAFRLAADAIVVIHFAFVLFVVLGGLLVLRWRWMAWLHLPAAAWGVLIEYANWICPLTPLENYLRERGGVGGYAGDFIEHYVLPLLYPARLTRSAQLLLGSLALALNALIYWYVIRKGKSVT
jgi:hypothetical protein